MNLRPDLIVFDDILFPSEIQLVSPGGRTKQTIVLDPPTTAKEKFKEIILAEAKEYSTFEAIAQAKILAEAVDVFEAIKITVIKKD